MGNVQFVRVPFDGVPSAPPLITGAPAVPTFTARAVAIPVPNPVIPPKATAEAEPAVRPDAVPVRFVAVMLDGVPPAPLKVTNAPANPTFTARAVATPVPRPVIPPTAMAEAVAALPPIFNEVAVPVRFVAVMLDGVPPAPLNVTKAPAEPTFIPNAVATPVPSAVMPVPPEATGRAAPSVNEAM